MSLQKCIYIWEAIKYECLIHHPCLLGFHMQSHLLLVCGVFFETHDPILSYHFCHQFYNNPKLFKKLSLIYSKKF